MFCKRIIKNQNVAISENCSYDKALPKLPYLSVFALFINVLLKFITHYFINYSSLCNY